MNAMTHALRPRTLALFVGDIFFFTFALWLSLFLRTFEYPAQDLFVSHLLPFTLLFVAWVAVFFIAGLYESRSIILERRRISASLLTSQVINIGIAALFFFFIPIFGIAPKTLLVIYLIVSFLLVLCWRVFLFPLISQKSEKAIVVGAGSEVNELVQALNSAHRAPAQIVEVVPVTQEVARDVQLAIQTHSPRFVIVDFTNPTVSAAFPALYNYLSQDIRFIDALSLYEDVFGRVPLSIINDEWIARNVSTYANSIYDVLKRAMDIVTAVVLGVISLALYPILMAAIKLQDGGRVFYKTTRIGQGNKPIRMYKFRTMTGADEGAEALQSKLTVTPTGGVLRRMRLDELPQLWSVWVGDLSLIGPRPELPALVEEYRKHIPYYTLRHLVKPGLSGWAQLYHDNHPHHGTEVEATREKLSYDLYYLKHRSLTLDVTIALKTIKKMLTQSGK